MESDLSEILTNLRESTGNRAVVSTGWSQGRSIFGGVAAALAVCAMRKRVPADRPLRSLLVSFVGPLLPGESEVRTTLTREGGSVSQISATIVQDGQTCLQALAAFGKPRPALEIAIDHGFGSTPPPRNTPLGGPQARRMPGFLRFFNGQWVSGGAPYSGDGKNRIDIWAAHRCDLGAFPEEALVAIADIPPPVLLNRFTDTHAPSSSLSWSLEFVVPAAEWLDRWFLLRFDIEWAAHGYTQQSGKIFSRDGRLAALSRQTMVYFPSKTKIPPVPTGESPG